MLMNLVLGISTMVICLLLQLVLFIAVFRYYVRRHDLVSNPSFLATLTVIKGVMLLLVSGILAQVGIWAMLFVVLDEFALFSEAFYHSAVNFATLGYGDFVMSAEHKLLGPLESINGVLMIGVSTAALMSAFQDAIGKTINARKGSKTD
jgi:hypothetical protein